LLNLLSFDVCNDLLKLKEHLYTALEMPTL